MTALERAAMRADAIARAASHAALRNARIALVAAAAITLLPLPGLLRIRLDTDANALVPRDDPAVRIDRQLRARFDLRDQLVVYVDGVHRGGIFDASLLAAVRDITDAVAAIPNIGWTHVTSLATEARDRLYPGTGQTFGTFLDTIPSTPAAMDELRRDLDLPSARVHTGIIVSADRRGTAILAGVAEGTDRIATYRAVREIVDAHRANGLDVHIAGAPAASALLADHIVRDLALFVPLSLLVAAIVIYAATRSMAPTVIVLAKAGLCIVWTFAILGWLGIPLYLTVTIVPLVLAAACIADEVHLALRFRRALAESGDAVRAARTAIDELALPVVAATLTTCIGFLSCVSATIEPVRALGAACAIGIAWSLAFSLFVTPSLFVLFSPRAGGAERPARRGLALSAPVALAITGSVTVVSLFGLPRLTIQDSWIECFAPGSEFRRATDRVNGALNGVHLLHTVVAAPMHEPSTIARAASLEGTMRRGETVGGVIGPGSQLAAVAEFWRMGDAMEDGRELERLYNRFDLSPGLDRRRRVVSDARDAAVVSAFLTDASFRATASLIETIRGATHDWGEVAFAGDIAVSQAMIPAVVRSQLVSLPLALAGVFLIATLLCGSFRLGFYAIVPAALSGIWLLGALGLTGTPLGVATSMFFTISIGLGVDSHSIHLVARWRRRGDPLETARQVAPAILLNTAAVAGGFGLIAFSAVPPNQRLGLLIAAALVAGCFITLTALPHVLALDRKTRNRGEAQSMATDVYPERQQEVTP